METKHLFRNQSPGVVGYVFYDESNKRQGGALQPEESVWLTERDLVATASAPRDSKDNPLDNGSLSHEATEGDPAHTRPIGVPGAAAPSSEPEPASASEESPEEPSGEGDAPAEEPTAEQAASEEAEAEAAERELQAKQRIEEAEERERKEKADAEAKAKKEADARQAAQKKTPAEEAAQRVGKEKADARPKPAAGAEETATEGESQGKRGEGKRSSTEATGTTDALSD